MFDTVGIMLDNLDLNNPADLERLRRSIAMAKPGANVLRREDALRLLNALLKQAP